MFKNIYIIGKRAEKMEATKDAVEEKKDVEVIKGRWWNISKEGGLPVLQAQYDRIKDWKMDPKGYFLIKLYPEQGEIGVGYCTFPDNKMRAEVRGKTALEIVNTLIREEMLSTLQHAADMGIELCKAEIALKKGLKYTQDDMLQI